MGEQTSKQKIEARKRRQTRVRAKLAGTETRPRLNVYRSLSNIYAQIIDDESGRTLVSASTIDKDVAAAIVGKTKVEASKVVGETVAQRAKEAGVSLVVFDRGGYRYHGRVAALAEGARAGGLEF